MTYTEYYLLRTESDPKIIGVDNGIAQVEINEESFESVSLYKDVIGFFSGINYWNKVNFFPEFDFEIRKVRIIDNANLTDFLSFSPYFIGCPFILSERAYDLLKQFKIQDHLIFKVSIFQNDKSFQYKLLYCPLLDYDIIDFSKSSFFTGTRVTGKKILTFKTVHEFLSYKKGSPLVRAEKIFLSKNFDVTLDLFFPRFGGVYISQRLKLAIERNKLSGMRIEKSVEPLVIVDGSMHG